MKLFEGVACESTADVVLTVVLLNVLKVRRMVNDVESEEGHGQLVSRTVSLIKRIPCMTAGCAVGLKLLDVSSERLSLGSSDPALVLGAWRPEAAVTIRPGDDYSFFSRYSRFSLRDSPPRAMRRAIMP